MKYYAWTMDRMEKPGIHEEEFETRLEAEAFAEAMGGRWHVHGMGKDFHGLKPKIERAVQDYLDKKTRHVIIR